MYSIEHHPPFVNSQEGAMRLSNLTRQGSGCHPPRLSNLTRQPAAATLPALGEGKLGSLL